MAAGFPTKSNFATGDVLTATQMNDLAGTVNLLKPTAKGSVFAASAANTPFELTVGADGTVLTADTASTGGVKWSTPAAGGMTLISTTTLTGATVSLTSIPATYNDLRLVIRNFLPATDAKGALLRFNSDSTANRHADIGTVTTAATAFASTSMGLGGRGDNAVTQSLIIVDIFDYKNTTTWKMARQTSIINDATTTTSYIFQMTHGAYNQTAAISSLDLIVESGGNFTSGSALLYGVK